MKAPSTVVSTRTRCANACGRNNTHNTATILPESHNRDAKLPSHRLLEPVHIPVWQAICRGLDFDARARRGVGSARRGRQKNIC
jgi:hypothetical protein